MHEHFIVFQTDPRGFGGNWGSGADIETAKKNLKKSGGDLRRKLDGIYRFTSNLPFAPPDRKATEEEADCWIGGDGSVSWVRCEREILTP